MSRHARDIAVSIAHPVPVATRSRRGGLPHLGFTEVETPVTIPYVAPEAIGTAEIRFGHQPDTTPWRFASHGGRLWEAVPRIRCPIAWGRHGTDWTQRLPLPVFGNIHDSRAAKRFQVGSVLGLVGTSLNQIRSPLTVNISQRLYERDAPPRGGSHASEEVVAACRAGIVDLAANALMHDGDCIYVAIPPLSLDPVSARRISLPRAAPHPAAPSFPHDEAEALIAWDPGVDAGKVLEASAELSRLQDAGTQTALAEIYANAAAPFVAEAARGVIRIGGGASAEARRRLDAFWPVLTLASVSCIRGDDLGPCLERIRDLASYVSTAHPTLARRIHMESVVSAIVTVVRPWTASAHLSNEADAEAIAGLVR